jgi:hypothetical protein
MAMWVISIAQTWFDRVIGKFAQEIGVDFVPRRRLGRVRSAVNRLDRHPLHQRRDMQASDK